MNPNQKSKNKIILFICTLPLTAAVLVWNDAVKEGVIAGIILCLNTVVPSLFPMLIISSFVASVGIPNGIKRFLFIGLRRITRLSDTCAEAFFFGGICGYPVGVKTTLSLLESGKINETQAQKSALINVNPGIAFSLLVAGKQFCGSVILGVTLYLSVTISNLLLCIFLRSSEKPKNENNNHNYEINISETLIRAVAGSVNSMVAICAWITVFSAFSALLIKLPAREIILLFSEVTNAVKISAAQQKYSVCAFEMGFGGFCIFFQLLPDLIKMHIKPWKYLLCRTFSGLCAGVLQYIFIKLIPGIVITSFSGNTVFKPSSGSVYGSAALIFMSIVFVLSLTDHLRPVKKF